MKDTQALAFLLKVHRVVSERTGRPKKGAQLLAAGEIGVEPPTFSMWLQRGIPNLMRFRVLEVLNKHGAKLPLEWAKPRLNGGATHGRAGKKVKGKRSRKGGAQQRRGAKRSGRQVVAKDRGGAGRRRTRSEAAQVAQG
jgi:hypothetical protein